MSISGLGSSPYVPTYQPLSFSSLDTNNDGSVSLDELEAAAPGGASATSNAQAQALFKAMDTNGDGSVSQGEMSAFDQKVQSHHHGGGHHHGGMGFLAQQLAQTQDSQAFGATDTNGDGSVSLDEFSADPAAQGVSSSDMQQLFNMIDTNGDGSISASESSSFLDKVRQAVGQADGGGQGGFGFGGAGFGFGGPDPTSGASANDPLGQLLQPASSTSTDGDGDSDGSPSNSSSSNGTTSPSDLLLMAANAYSGSTQPPDLVGMLQTLLQTAA